MCRLVKSLTIAMSLSCMQAALASDESSLKRVKFKIENQLNQKQPELGTQVPEEIKFYVGDNKAQAFARDIFKPDSTVLVFVMSGAFTPTCTGKHLSGVAAKIDALKKYVDTVAVVTRDSIDVVNAWLNAAPSGRGAEILGISDFTANFMDFLGILHKPQVQGALFSNHRLGVFPKRTVAIVKNGALVYMEVEEPGACLLTEAETVLGLLEKEPSLQKAKL